MNMCKHLPTAVRIRERTLSTIAVLNDGVEPQIEEKPTFFMIYCHGSDHEETQIIDETTYDRTYEPMPTHIDAMRVTTID